MNVRVVSWMPPMGASNPEKKVVKRASRRELEQDVVGGSEARMVATLLSRFDTGGNGRVRSFVGMVPEWLATSTDIPTNNDHALLFVDTARSTPRHLRVVKAVVEDDGRVRQVAVEATVPRTAVRIYDGTAVRPSIECWDCGEVFVTHDAAVIAEKRRFEDPQTGEQRLEWLCDECATVLVDSESQCDACGEMRSSVVGREIAGREEQLQLCLPCAESVSVGDADRQIRSVNP